jgi:hypothetical protein
MTRGDIYTIAGNGTQGYSGDGGPATSAELDPEGVAVDGGGDLLIADRPDDRVRLVAGLVVLERLPVRACVDDQGRHLHRRRRRHRGVFGGRRTGHQRRALLPRQRRG